MNPRLLLFNVFFLIIFCCSAAQIDAYRFGAIPDDGKDDTSALRKAAAYCRENPGTTLFIRPGTYNISDKDAVRLEREACEGKFGINVEETVFKPYFPYVKGLDFSGATNVTVIADGATLMCEGWMEPVSLVATSNFTLQGLSIDYLRKPFSSGTISETGQGWFDVIFDSARQIKPGLPMMRMTVWDPGRNRVDPSALFYFPSHEILTGNTVRFHADISEALKGCRVNVNHCFHFRPAILILDSSNTTIERVTIHSQPGMGIVGFNSKDITLKNLSVRPSTGYTQSTNTDATHFAACRGTIHFEGCYFEGQGDDATNVHGYYQSVNSSDGNDARLQIKARTYTHAQVIDAPGVGDTLEIVEKKTLRPIATTVVEEVNFGPESIECDVKLSAPLPTDYDNYYLMNISKLPKLIFENCVVNSHLARGVLVKTRGVVIRNNIFRHCTGTAIHIGAEASWHEGSHASDVTVEDNTMFGCGSGAGSQGGASGISVIIEADDTSSSLLHQRITIRNNMIMGEGNRCGIFVGNAADVTISNNSISACSDYIITANTAGLTISR